jgi:hypothetical protein
VDRFLRKEIQGGRSPKGRYEAVPKSARRPQYYVRENYTLREGEAPTYHFFTQPEVKIQKFQAFLIPPLDFGHGQRDDYEQRLTLRLDEKWRHYLEEIGRRAERSAKIGRFRNKKYLLFHDEVIFSARRIVFFDRDILRLFLTETEWLIQNAQIKGGQFDREARKTPLLDFCRGTILYAVDIAMIHQISWTYREFVHCFYLSTSEVLSSEYYDFGLYNVDGTPIVYQPIYRKDNRKAVNEERVLVGTTREQLLRIEEFEADFEALWERAQSSQIEQKALEDEFLTRYRPADIEDKYYKLPALSPYYFRRGYFEQIEKQLKKYGIRDDS